MSRGEGDRVLESGPGVTRAVRTDARGRGGPRRGGAGWSAPASRRVLAAGAVLAMLLAAGCERNGGGERPTGQAVEAVAGGGESASGPASGARIDGRLIDLAVDGGGTVRVLTDTRDGLTLWTAPAGGELTHVVIRGVEARDASQLAVGPGGEVHLAAARSVWRIGPDGAATRVVGSGRAGPSSPDGTRADQARAFKVTGVAVTGDGTLYYAEELADPQFLTLVRTVRDGRIRTVLGRLPARTASESDVTAAIARSGDPAPGTRATELVVGGVQSRLAVGSGGMLYVSRDAHSVLALRPDGTAAAVIAGRAPQVVRVPTAPFEPIGDAADALPELFLGGSRVSLGGDPTSGDLYLVTRVGADTGTGPAGPFVWSGSLSAAQKDLVARQRAGVVVWRVDGRGRLAAAAYGADAVAVQGGWLYLAVDLAGEQARDRRVLVLRTAIQR